VEIGQTIVWVASIVSIHVEYTVSDLSEPWASMSRPKATLIVAFLGVRDGAGGVANAGRLAGGGHLQHRRRGGASKQVTG
jgi:hypothetical protein